MDELFEAYLAVYEAFNEKGEFRRDDEDAPSRVTLSPEELAKRRARGYRRTENFINMIYFKF